MRRGWISLVLSMLVFVVGCASRPTFDHARAKAHLADAHTYLDRGWLVAARAAFALAIEENPSLTEAHLGIGHLFRQDGDLARAERAYEEAAGLAAGSFDAHYHLGLTRQLRGKLEKAVASYLRALIVEPTSAAANRHLAAAMLQLGRPADARPYAQAAVDLTPSDQGAWANLGAICHQLGDYDAAINAYRAAAELGDMAPPILLGLADSHLKQGNLDRARVVFEALDRQSPNAAARERIGYIHYRRQQYDEALKAYRSAASLAPDNPAILNGLGVCRMTLYLQSDRTQRAHHRAAIAAWRRSLQVSPAQSRIADLIARYERM